MAVPASRAECSSSVATLGEVGERPFTRAAWAVAAAWGWATAVAVPTAVVWLGQSWAVASTITVGSGLVAAVALAPGLRWQSRRAVTGDAASWGRLSDLLSAMAIRLLGTVALFMLCRYQMAAVSAQSIAIWVLAWYAWLTAVEVTAVVRELNRPQSTPGRRET